MESVNETPMKTSFKRLTAIIGITVAVGLLAIELPHAGMSNRDLLVAQIPVERLDNEAQLVVQGAVTKRLGTVREVDETGDEMVYTRWQIKPENTYKGRHQRTVVVRTLGGQFLTTVVEVDDQPRFTVGERVMVYLLEVPNWKGDFRTVGEFQGKFELAGAAADADAIQSGTKKKFKKSELEAFLVE